ncbi:MAG: DUF2281 domain-containing protein [Thermodesulfobacteriota bacterium]
MTQVDIEQAGNRFLELIELALSGEEVIISRDRRPLVKLAPIRAQRQPRRFGSARGLITMTEDFDKPLEDFREYM